MDDGGWRVAFDVAPLRARPAGVGVYVRSLAAALAGALPGRLSLIGVRPEAELGPALADGVPRWPFSRRHYHAWMQLGAARSAARTRADLVHFTNAAAPILGGRPFVVTVHDLSVMRMPRHHPWSRIATVPVSLLAIGGAKAIIVPSGATADELRRVLHLSSRRLHVVEHAAILSPPSPERVAEVVARLGLRHGRYLVAPGTVEPRKNHVRLVAAFERLIEAGHDLQLVIVGEIGWRAGRIVRRIEASPAAGRITTTGYLADTDLAALLAGSAAACYVSLYEGFGLPVIDAMAVGAPVVTSRASSMPQAAGGAGVLVDPLDVPDIARGIDEAISRRDELIEAGRLRTGRRTWSDVARETVEVYRQVLGG